MERLGPVIRPQVKAVQTVQTVQTFSMTGIHRQDKFMDSMDMSRYDRQMMLPEIGETGQRKLSEARVLVVGVGGLGSPVSLYLAGAGVGTIGLADEDTVSVTNLQRQILYSEGQTGLYKAECAGERLAGLNGSIRTVVHRCRIDRSNADSILSGYDIVVDGCDNFATRYVLSDACARAGKPYVYGAITDFTGQVAVLCCGKRTYRDLFPDENAITGSAAPSKAVIGVTPAMAGVMQASETIKLICGFGETLVDRLWSFDLRDNSFFTINL